LDNKKREGLEAQVASLQARLASLDAQIAELRKSLAGYEQDLRELNKPIQTGIASKLDVFV
jgi:septal ring factor EnvC (AmiA/AmiB activator)